MDKPGLLPFWQTLLGYEDTPDDDLVDPLGRDPRVWFYETEPRPLRNRFHFDVSVPADEIASRVAAVQVSGANAGYSPEEWRVLLIDPEGNEVDFVPGDDPEGDLRTAGWRLPFSGMVFYPTDDLGVAADLAGRVAAVADGIGLPLLIDIRRAGVVIDTGKDQWEDARFVETARAVSGIAAELGLAADPSRLRFWQVGLDAADVLAIRAFWRATLGYVDDPRPEVTDIYDPRRLHHPMIFQQIDLTEVDRRAQRNRIHLDLYVPSDQVDARRAAALAAGGRLVREGGTIADPEGNEVDIGTALA